MGSVYSDEDVGGCLCLWFLESERVEMIVWFDRRHQCYVEVSDTVVLLRFDCYGVRVVLQNIPWLSRGAEMAHHDQSSYGRGGLLDDEFSAMVRPMKGSQCLHKAD